MRSALLMWLCCNLTIIATWGCCGASLDPNCHSKCHQPCFDGCAQCGSAIGQVKLLIAEATNAVYRLSLEGLAQRSSQGTEELNRLAKDHISFLTNKLSFLSILITIVFGVLSVVAVAVPIIAGMKLSEYKNDIRDIRTKAESAVAHLEGLEKAVRKAQKESLQHLAKSYYLRAKEECEHYRAAVLGGGVPQKTRQSMVRAYCLDLLQGLNYSCRGDAVNLLYRMLQTAMMFSLMLKTSIGSSDAACVARDHKAVLEVSISEIEKKVSKVAIKARSAGLAMKMLVCFLDAVKVSYRRH